MLRKSLASVTLAAFIMLSACNGDASHQARGVIVDVKSASLIEWDSLTLRRADGTALTFSRGVGVDLRFWRASHLREHMSGAAPVTVTYKKSKAGLVATTISD
jgi:hypothetical protein